MYRINTANLVQNKLFICKEWHIQPSEIDRMFYYDDQYLDQIIPDTDITYCDISTGQYYKWNGVSYILIVF